MPLKAGSSKSVVPSKRKHRDAERFSEGNNSLHDVEIFAAGEHRDKQYTSADLDDMVRNFKRFCTDQKPGFRVPLVIGHEETQEYLDRSDLPAAGWASRVWRDGDKLMADFEDVPEKVARLLRGKAYRTVSSEVYDEPPEGIPAHGKMLRRVALLGGDIPQLKDLDDIPVPRAHSEKRRFARYQRVSLSLRDIRRSKTPGAYWCYSEAKPMSVESFGPEPGSKPAKAMWAKATLSGAKKKKGGYSKKKMKSGTPKGGWGFDEGDGEGMDRDDMISKLAEHGFDTGTLKDTPDEALAETLRVCEDKDAQHDDHDDGEPEDKEESQEFDDSDPETGLEEHAGDNLPEPKTMAEAQRYAEHALKHFKKFCNMQKHAEGEDDDESLPERKKEEEAVDKHHERGSLVKTIRREIQAAINGEVKQSLAKLEKFREEQLRTARRASSEEIADQFVREGRLPPAERDDFVEALYEADDTRIRKFNENGKSVSLTARDRLIRMVKNRHTLFSEHFKDPKPAAGAEGDSEAIVAAHFDKFHEDYQKNGYSREKVVSEFKALNAENQAAMLEEYRRSLQSA